jgi:hypothetical protein
MIRVDGNLEQVTLVTTPLIIRLKIKYIYTLTIQINMFGTILWNMCIQGLHTERLIDYQL